MSKSMKNLRFQNPTQLLIQGQWWSMLSTHLLQAEQWWHLSGLNTLHIRQYRLRLFSGSPRWKPQNTGTWPGSVVIDCMKDQNIRMKNRWKKASNTLTPKLSISIMKLNGSAVDWLTCSTRSPNYNDIGVVDHENNGKYKKHEQITNYFSRSHRKSSGHV